MRSSGQAVIQYDYCLYKKRKLDPHTPREGVHVKTLVILDYSLSLMTSFDLNLSLRITVLKYESHLDWSRFQHLVLGSGSCSPRFLAYLYPTPKSLYFVIVGGIEAELSDSIRIVGDEVSLDNRWESSFRGVLINSGSGENYIIKENR